MNTLQSSVLAYSSNTGLSSIDSRSSSLKSNVKDTTTSAAVATADANSTGVIKRTDYRNANLHGMDFSGQDLSGFDFSGADLHGANFTNAKLTGANLSRADLHGATMTGADLSSVNMSSSALFGADLTKANLTGANLSGAGAFGANMQGADLRQAQIGNADLHGGDLTGANTTGVDFSQANMRGVIGYGDTEQTEPANLAPRNIEFGNLQEASSKITSVSTDELNKLTKLDPAAANQQKCLTAAYSKSALSQANTTSQSVLTLL